MIVVQYKHYIKEALNDMDINAIAKNLNKNVEVVESTFTQNNLQLISYGFCGISEDNGWMELLIEIATLEGTSINNSVSVKANFYDGDNIIIYSYDTKVDANDFEGYDTVHLYLNENNLAFNAVKCRLFATRA